MHPRFLFYFMNEETEAQKKGLVSSYIHAQPVQQLNFKHPPPGFRGHCGRIEEGMDALVTEWWPE